MLNGIALGKILNIFTKPGLGGHPLPNRRILPIRRSSVVKVWCVACTAGSSVFFQLYEMDVFGNCSALSIFQNDSILHRILDVEQQFCILTVIGIVNEYCTAFHDIHILFSDQIDGCLQKRMTGAKQSRLGQSGNVAIHFIKANTLIPIEYAFPKADLNISVPNGIGNGSDFVSACFPLSDFPSEAFERFQEKCLNEVWLQFMRFHPLHVFTDCIHSVHIHHIIC